MNVNFIFKTVSALSGDTDSYQKCVCALLHRMQARTIKLCFVSLEFLVPNNGNITLHVVFLFLQHFSSDAIVESNEDFTSILALLDCMCHGE